MNSNWNSFLSQQNTAPSSALSAGQIEASDGDTIGLFNLEGFSLVRVAGEDALEFLQGQFTNDIREVSEAHFQMNSYCTPKGRALANFRVISDGQGYLLQMPTASAEILLKRLPMFILRSRVEITDLSQQWACVGLAGNGASELLQSLELPAPGSAGESATASGVTACRLQSQPERFLLLGQTEAMKSAWSRLQERATPGPLTTWNQLEIRAGIPWISAETREAFVPQMINLQLIDGVSFTKGCYTGQEVVARMRYLGKLKRQMYLAHLESGELPEAGTDLFCSASESPQGAGKVVNAVTDGEGGADLLAVIEIDSASNGEIRLRDADGPKLELRRLPYDFESAR